MLKEGNEACGNGDQLGWSDVHVVHLVVLDRAELASDPDAHELFGEASVFIHGRVGLGNLELVLLNGTQELDALGDNALFHLQVGGLDETELVDASVGGQRGDQADVRAFRSLDWADASVVRGVNVADVKASALTGQTAWTQGAQAALVGDLGERVGLVHELRELAGPKELVDGASDRLGVDEVVQHHRFGIVQGHALLDGALHTDEANAELRLQQFPDATHPAVAEVVDVVDLALRVAFPELKEVPDRLQNVCEGQNLLVEGVVEAELLVDLEAAHAAEAVALIAEEEVPEHGVSGFQRGRIAGLHALVQLNLGLIRALNLVEGHGFMERGSHGLGAGVEHLNALNAIFNEGPDAFAGQRSIALNQNLAVHGEGLGRDAALDFFPGNGNAGNAGGFEFGEGPAVQARVRFRQQLSGFLIDDRQRGSVVQRGGGVEGLVEVLGFELEAGVDFGEVEGFELVELLEDLLFVQA